MWAIRTKRRRLLGQRPPEGRDYFGRREHLHPAEVEQVLYGMDEVEDASVVGRPDGKWGEVPVAVIALRDGAALDKETLAGRFDGVLARFKHPKDVVFVDEFPRNAMGKILKYELRDIVAEA